MNLTLKALLFDICMLYRSSKNSLFVNFSTIAVQHLYFCLTYPSPPTGFCVGANLKLLVRSLTSIYMRDMIQVMQENVICTAHVKVFHMVLLRCVSLRLTYQPRMGFVTHLLRLLQEQSRTIGRTIAL